MHRAFIPIAALAWACGCSEAPQLNPAQTQAIYDDARTLLDKYSSTGEIEATLWPDSLRALRPETVRSSEEGLYIVTWSRWAEETGIFVPRDRQSFSPQQGADPEYRLISGAVFVYRVRG